MIIIDVETTGIDENVHCIIEIYAMDYDNPDNFFYRKVKMRPGAVLNPVAAEVNGFRVEDNDDPERVTLEAMVTEFDAWSNGIEDRTMMAQNPEFDTRFFQDSYKRAGSEWPFGYRTVDLHSIAYATAQRIGYDIPLAKRNISNFNSDTIMEFVGLEPEPRPHRARNGARWEAEAYSRLVHGKNLLPEFSQYKIPEYLTQSGTI